MSAKRDKSQGFAFYINGEAFTFGKLDDTVRTKSTEIDLYSFLDNAMALLESGEHSELAVIEVLIEELELRLEAFKRK